jgi:hypothetical protein
LLLPFDARAVTRRVNDSATAASLIATGVWALLDTSPAPSTTS